GRRVRQQGRVIGSRASGWHPRGRAAPIDAQAVEAARPKLITARQERAARDLIESISNVTRIKIIRALAETPLAAGDLARVVDRTAPASSERRSITVLFADIAGSTAIAERMDPEDWTALVGEAFKRMTSTIERYDGTIARLMGDGVLAFFGAPVAHEDDPERAVRCGL